MLKNSYLSQEKNHLFNQIFHQIIIIIALIFTSLFFLWWFQLSNIPNNFQGFWGLLDIVLFLIVSYVVWQPIIMAWFNWLVASHIKNNIETPKPKKNLKVAFLTTFVPASESIELLHQCLPSMVKADYPHDTWLLDEGNSKEAQEICKQYGVKYFTRNGLDHYNQESGKFKAKTKGGNHNAWHDTHGHNYDIIAQMDTDFVSSKNFLTQTLGYFNNPKVAYVVTPQIYGNTEESFVAKGAAEQAYSFYGAVMRGLDGMNMNTLIGANHLIRVKALKSVDHYSAHITEDLLTGMKLHSKGWESVYVPEVLAIGEGPSTWRAYFSQQMRWAYGCMDILLNHSFELFKSMTLRQKIYYFVLQQHYFSGAASIIGIMGSIAYFFFGLQVAQMELLPFLIFYLPILGFMEIINFWLQKFNVRPDEERGMLWAGRFINIAAWPIFFLALIGVIRKSNLSYKVTPKGATKKVVEKNFSLFIPHLIIALISLICILSVFFTGRDSIVFIFYGGLTFLTLLIVPFLDIMYKVIKGFKKRYNIFEYDSAIKELIPIQVSDTEKYIYSDRGYHTLIGFSIISFVFAMISSSTFLYNTPALWVLSPFIILTIVYYIVSLLVNFNTKNFNILEHNKIVNNWIPKKFPSVDIFLPTCGEDLRVLNNTWEGVLSLVNNYKGNIIVYVLDDSNRESVKSLAEEYKFTYSVRPNPGEFKKAGNLRYGFSISKGDFIIIFDADFKPNKDFLKELLPYMYAHKKVGIIQSPQYFDINHNQNWLERGAGSTQELFYRFTQVARNHYKSAICVGSNAIYRRKALNDIGGTALIEHSEDVHTGFNLRIAGWDVFYVPVVLAKGLCPESMRPFFNQQYRWCMGSMSLMRSGKFWNLKLKPRARLAYVSGFIYYIHTALASIIAPIIPIYILIFEPEAIQLHHISILLPSFIYLWVIFPLWHNHSYGIEVKSVQNIYGWAHIIAIFNIFTNTAMAWNPTGSKSKNSSNIRYSIFRILQIIFNLIPGIIWVCTSAYYLFVLQQLDFILIFLGGLLYLSIVSKVSFYKEVKDEYQSNWFTVLRYKIFNLRYILAPSAVVIVYLFTYVNVFNLYAKGVKINSDLGIEPIQFVKNSPTESSPVIQETSAQMSSDNSKIKPEKYTFSVQAGEGVSQIARKAILAYTDENNMSLSAEQKIFIETTLKNKYYKKSLEMNESISFETSVINDTINQAQNLTPNQINAWGRYI